MRGDIKYVNLFRNSAGECWMNLAYSDEERDAQIEKQKAEGHELVKTYNRNVGEIQ